MLTEVVPKAAIPIPEPVWKRILEYLSEGKFGKIELDVSDGKVVSCRLTETIRVRHDDASAVIQTGRHAQ